MLRAMYTASPVDHVQDTWKWWVGALPGGANSEKPKGNGRAWTCKFLKQRREHSAPVRVVVPGKSWSWIGYGEALIIGTLVEVGDEPQD